MDTSSSPGPGGTKTVLVVLAGACDPPGEGTPLVEAETPALDEMARLGRAGVVKLGARTAWDGFVRLLGFGGGASAGSGEPLSGPSLGVAEALGIGIGVPPGRTASRADFVTLSDERLRDPTGGKIDGAEADALIEAVRQGVGNGGAAGTGGIELVRLARHRNLLLHGFEPTFCPSPWEVTAHRPESALPTDGPVRHLYDGARAALRDHDVNVVRVDLGENPANALWIHGAGRMPRPAPADHVLRHAVLVGRGACTRGLADWMGSTASVVAGDDDVLVAAALSAMAENDVVIVRTTTVLDAGLEGDPTAKRDALSAVDARLVAPLLRALEEQDAYRLAVACDSVLETSTHRLVPGCAPFVVHGTGMISGAPAQGRAFDERACDLGGLRVSPADFLALLLG